MQLYKNSTEICVYILSLDLKVLKLAIGICNTRRFQELEYAWWVKIMLRSLDLPYNIGLSNEKHPQNLMMSCTCMNFI